MFGLIESKRFTMILVKLILGASTKSQCHRNFVKLTTISIMHSKCTQINWSKYLPCVMKMLLHTLL